MYGDQGTRSLTYGDVYLISTPKFQTDDPHHDLRKSSTGSCTSEPPKGKVSFFHPG